MRALAVLYLPTIYTYLKFNCCLTSCVTNINKIKIVLKRIGLTFKFNSRNLGSISPSIY